MFWHFRRGSGCLEWCGDNNKCFYLKLQHTCNIRSTKTQSRTQTEIPARDKAVKIKEVRATPRTSCLMVCLLFQIISKEWHTHWGHIQDIKKGTQNVQSASEDEEFCALRGGNGEGETSKTVCSAVFLMILSCRCAKTPRKKKIKENQKYQRHVNQRDYNVIQRQSSSSQ